MDIAALSSSMAQASLGQQVGLAVAKLAMDTAKQNSVQMTKMMEQSVNPNVGKTIDVSI